jgi:hypothetical protein
MNIPILALALSALVLLPSLDATAQYAEGAYAGTCQTDDDIASEERKEIEEQAQRFVEKLIPLNPAKLDSAEFNRGLAPDLRKEIAESLLIALNSEPSAPGVPPITSDVTFSNANLHVAHTYLETMTHAGKPSTPGVCTAVARGDISKPQNQVFIELKPVPKLAYTVIEADTRNGKIDFVLSLLPGEGSWYVSTAQFRAASVVGHSADDLWAIAQDQQRKSHNFNAFLFAVKALALTDRGSHFHLGLQPVIESELKRFQVPPELQGQPPITWKFGNKSFKVMRVEVLGVAGEFYLVIRQQIAPWRDNDAADQQNRTLLLAFSKEFPEYQDVFSGFAIEAVDEMGHGYRTVDVCEKCGLGK